MARPAHGADDAISRELGSPGGSKSGLWGVSHAQNRMALSFSGTSEPPPSDSPLAPRNLHADGSRHLHASNPGPPERRGVEPHPVAGVDGVHVRPLRVAPGPQR